MLQAWGQNLIGTSASSILSASTPLGSGWSEEITTQKDNGSTLLYRVTYYTDTPADYIRPNNDLGVFSLTLDDVNIPTGNAVLYFNESNDGLDPSDSANYPAIVYPGAGTDSGFDATLGVVVAVPEPGGVTVCAEGFAFALAAVCVRWRKSRRKARAHGTRS